MQIRSVFLMIPTGEIQAMRQHTQHSSVYNIGIKTNQLEMVIYTFLGEQSDSSTALQIIITIQQI